MTIFTQVLLDHAYMLDLTFLVLWDSIFFKCHKNTNDPPHLIIRKCILNESQMYLTNIALRVL